MADFLILTTCAASTDSMMLIALLVFVSMFLIIMGFVSKLGFFGIFGSLALLVTSWYLSPCVGLIAFIVAGLAVLLFIFFAIGNKNPYV